MVCQGDALDIGDYFQQEPTLLSCNARKVSLDRFLITIVNCSCLHLYKMLNLGKKMPKPAHFSFTALAALALEQGIPHFSVP